MKTAKDFKVGQKVTYRNGTSTYSGTIVKIYQNHQLVIIDCESGMVLWNAGYSVGSCVPFSQVI